jgi:hypothetical protein
MAFRKRSATSHWRNDEPIKNLYEAIDTLSSENSSRDPVHLRKRESEAGDGYEIVWPWYREGSSGGDSWGIEYYEIDTATAEELIREHFVAPRRVKHLGYTETRDDELVVTDIAREKLDLFEKEMERKAESMLTPGIHTDLAGKPKRLCWSRDGFRCGRLYFEYELPEERGRVRVYPEEQRLVMPEEAASAK